MDAWITLALFLIATFGPLIGITAYMIARERRLKIGAHYDPFHHDNS